MNFRKISDKERIHENEEEYDNIDEEEADMLSPRRGGTRGPSQFQYLVFLQGQGCRSDVTFDECGVPIDKEGQHFINFLGVLVWH